MTGTIELYLVRHAIAAERGDEWPDDTKRPLTREGMARFEREVAGLACLQLKIDLVLSSPLVRARQTAKLLAEGLRKTPTVKILPALAPGTSPAIVLAAVKSATRRQRIVLVGHEPDLGEFASFLLGTGRPLEFKKGAVCRVDVARTGPPPVGSLVWFAPPRLLRAAGS